MIILTPYNGFVNQMIGILASIELGTIVKENIIIDGFMKQYNARNDIIPISNILNMKESNMKLKEKGFSSIEDIETIENKSISIRHQIIIPRYYKTVDEAIRTYRKNYMNTTYTIFHVGNFIVEDLRPIHAEIFKCLRFQNKFYNKVDEFLSDENKYNEKTDSTIDVNSNIISNNISSPKLSDCFNSIHLRIENDMLKHLDKVIFNGRRKYMEEIIEQYNIYFEMMKEEPIFVATGLHKDIKDKYNGYLNSIRKTHDIRLTPKKLFDGRELNAIVDFLICLKSTSFIGLKYSTFSRLVDMILVTEGKKSILIEI